MTAMKAHSEKLILLFSRDEISERVEELAKSISADYAGCDLVLIGILRGSFVFLADLVRQLTIPVEVDFIGAASYGSRTKSSGKVVLNKDLQLPVMGRDLLLVEDIEDTGLTLQTIYETLNARKPRSIKICALIDKRERRAVDLQVDYVGFEVAEGFIVGYGIDYAERYRYLPNIYRIEGLIDSEE